MLKLNLCNRPRRNNTALAVLNAAAHSFLPGAFVFKVVKGG